MRSLVILLKQALVGDVTSTLWVLLGVGLGYYSVEVEDHPREPGALPVFAANNQIEVGFLETLGIDLLDGRTFQEGDGAEGSRAVIVSESFAAHWWPGESALGRRMRLGYEGEDWYDIVGVVADTHYVAWRPLARRATREQIPTISLDSEIGGDGVLDRVDCDTSRLIGQASEKPVRIDVAQHKGAIRERGCAIRPQRYEVGVQQLQQRVSKPLARLARFGRQHFDGQAGHDPAKLARRLGDFIDEALAAIRVRPRPRPHTTYSSLPPGESAGYPVPRAAPRGQRTGSRAST